MNQTFGNSLDYLASLSPYLIIILFSLFYIYTNNKIFLYFVGFAIVFGLLFNSIEKKIFSQIFNGDYFIYRPNPYNKNGVLNTYSQCGFLPNTKSSNIGFPSGHAQFWGFVISFWTLYLITPLSGTLFLLKNNKDNFGLLILLWSCGLYVLYSRIKIGCHTKLQVFSGFLIGIILGSLVYKLFI